MSVIWWILSNVFSSVTQIHIKLRSPPSSQKFPSYPFLVNLYCSPQSNSQRQPIFSFFHPGLVFILALYIIIIIQYTLFYVRLLSHTLMFWRVTYVVSCIIIYFFLLLRCIPAYEYATISLAVFCLWTPEIFPGFWSL